MKKTSFILYGLLLMLLGSCATTNPPLYTWNNYSVSTYNYVKSKTDADRNALIKTYEKIINKQVGTRKCVPPGVYADYGFLLIQTGQNEKGKEMLTKEIALYPESKVFIERLLNNMAQ